MYFSAFNADSPPPPTHHQFLLTSPAEWGAFRGRTWAVKGAELRGPDQMKQNQGSLLFSLG